MQGELKRLLWLHSLFLGVVIFSNLFINLYLWSVLQEFGKLGQYNLVVALFTFIGFILGMYIIRIRHIRVSFNVAVLFMLGVFLLLLWKQSDIVKWYRLLGLMYGVGLGLYYSGFNLISFSLTGDEGRDRFFGWEQIINRTVSLLIPLSFSFIVPWLGYRGTFGIIAIILGICIAFTFFVPKMTMDFTLLNLKYQEVWKEYKTILVSISGFGFLQSWIQIASSALLLAYIANETKVGLWNAVFAAIGIVMGYWMSRSLHAKNRKRWAWIGTVLLTSAALFMIYPGVWSALLFNILAVTTLPMIWLPITVVHYNRISDLSCPSVDRCDIALSSHYLVIREFMLNLGRVLFFAFMAAGFTFRQTQIPFYMIFVIGFLPVLIYRYNTLFLAGEARK